MGGGTEVFAGCAAGPEALPCMYPAYNRYVVIVYVVASVEKLGLVDWI